MTLLLTDRAIGGSAPSGAGRPLYSRLSRAEVGAGLFRTFFYGRHFPTEVQESRHPYNDFDCIGRETGMFSPDGFPLYGIT